MNASLSYQPAVFLLGRSTHVRRCTGACFAETTARDFGLAWPPENRRGFWPDVAACYHVDCDCTKLCLTHRTTQLITRTLRGNLNGLHCFAGQAPPHKTRRTSCLTRAARPTDREIECPSGPTDRPEENR